MKTITKHGEPTTAQKVIDAMMSIAEVAKVPHLMRFFKTAPGEYGHGDQFLGIMVPETRKIAAQYKQLPLSEVQTLLASPWHEVRLCGLLVLVNQFDSLSKRRLVNDEQATARRDEILEFYLRNAQCANNWDLVDLSAYKIIGRWLMLPSHYSGEQKLETLDRLAGSDNLWEQRMSVVCTMEPLKHGDASFTLRYAQWHLHHQHDLMHKAVGWLLREMGKRVSMDLLRQFLAKHSNEMPRTMLRYSIEQMPVEERKRWMRK